MTLREAADKFVEITTWIRELSSPQITDISSAEEYREKLMVNFRRIGDISSINAHLLREYLLPILESSRPLSDEEISVLQDLKDKLMDAYAMDNLDVPFLYRVTLRLHKDAERKQDTEAIIKSLDDYVMAAYGLLATVRRIYPYCDQAIKCREDGLAAANRILEYLPADKFKTLEDPSVREAVLINARYIMTLYEYPLTEDDRNLTDEILATLKRALSLLESADHRALASDFDWLYHEFRTLHYFSVMTIFNNAYGFSKAQLEELNSYAKRMMDVWEREKGTLTPHNTSGTIQFAAARCAHLVGEIDTETYKKELRQLAAGTHKGIYNADEMQLHTSMPIEYILVMDPDNITKDDAEALTEFYKSLLIYIHKMPKLGHLSFLLSEQIFLLEKFIEVEGGLSFETMCMELLAAIHPPTYVHSLSVADLSVCLAESLFEKHSEMFERTPGYPDIDEIKKFVWHAAACHDAGKLSIIETIITYGRSLYDQEFEWIRSHPEVGASLLSKHASTKDYAEVALGHQRWYDGKGGYPEAYDPDKAANRLIVDIVACADCLDAATDTVGRSYKQGKTLDDFIAELKDGLGTRYAPFLMELFEDPKVYKELQTILSDGRDDKYRHTFTVLKEMLTQD